MVFDNAVTIEMDARSQNESFARVAVAAFAAQLDPTVEELTDIRTAVSEAVTNAVIHGYEGRTDGKVHIECGICGDIFHVIVRDDGIGIQDISQAMAPLYTSKPEMERSGMGFTVMETFMDSIQVESEPGKGVSVVMERKISQGRGNNQNDGEIQP